MVMTKTTCGVILTFVRFIINTKSFKQKYTDTWIELTLLKDVYKEYLKQINQLTIGHLLIN